MTSLMFLILLGIASCDILCLQATSTNLCPDGITGVKTEADLVIKNAGTIIYTDSAIATKLTDANINKVTEIVSIDKTNSKPAVKVTLADSSTPTSASLSLTGIALTIAAASEGKQLKTGEKLTITSLTLNSGSTVTGSAALVEIKALTCDAWESATPAITYTKGSLTIIGDDLINAIEGKTGPAATISYGATPSTIDIAATVTPVVITSRVTSPTVFTIKGTFEDFDPAKFLITLEYGNGGKAPLTLKADSPTIVEKKIIIVKTYYTIDDSLTTAFQKMFTLDAAFALTAGKRAAVPKSAAYCLDKLFLRVEGCPKDAEVLWSNDELKSMSNEYKMIDLYVSGHNADGDILNLDLADYKEKSIKFSSVDDTNQQQIEFKFAADAETVTGNLQFNNIKVTALLKAGSTEGTLGFKSLFIRKSEIIAKNAAAPTASKNLKTATIKVTSEDLTSDSDSFKKFLLDVPTRSFSIIDIKSANFKGDGKSVKIDGTTDLTDKNIPTPFKIVLLPGEEPDAPIDLTMTKDDKGGKAALPFSFDLQKDAKLKVDFTGEWDATNIVVNVADGAKFTGTTKTGDGNKAPLMKYTGAGTVELDGNPVEKDEQPAGATPTPKGGLSGGAIAGIVIACVVVVAAVVVVVVIVIKKKKGKVAN